MDAFTSCENGKQQREDNSGEDRSTARCSWFGVALLGGLGLVAAADYAAALGGTEILVKRQYLWLAVGAAAALGISFTPHGRYRRDMPRWLPWLFFVLGILLLAALPAIGTEISGHHLRIRAGGVSINATLWGSLLLLPGLARLLTGRLSPGTFLALAGTLFFVNLVLVATHQSSALFCFDGTMILLLLFAGISQGGKLGSVRCRAWAFFALAAVVSCFALMPLVDLVCSQPSRLVQLLAAWQPQGDMKRVENFHAWTVHRNFLDGELLGAQEPFIVSRCVYGKAAISDFVLQMPAFRFGLPATAVLLAFSVLLAFLWIRHALRTPGPEERLWRLGLALFLILHMVGSTARTTGLIPFMPSMAFPFLAYGGNITLWSFVCLGLLLRPVHPGHVRTEHEQPSREEII